MMQLTSPRDKMTGEDQGTNSVLTVEGVVLTRNGWDKTSLRRKHRREQFDDVLEALLRYLDLQKVSVVVMYFHL